MHLEVICRHLPTSEPLLAYAHHRLRSSLERLSHAIDSVVLRVQRLGSARGATSCRCCAVVHLASGERLVVTEDESDLYRALDRITNRARTALVRLRGRRRQRRRSRRRSLDPLA